MDVIRHQHKRRHVPNALGQRPANLVAHDIPHGCIVEQGQPLYKRSRYIVVTCPYVDVLPFHNVVLAALAGYPCWRWCLSVSGTSSRNTEKHIGARRRALGITQEERAERAGLSANYVAKLEIAMNAPSLPALSRLAEALQVDAVLLSPPGERFTEHTDRVETVAREFERLNEREEESWVV